MYVHLLPSHQSSHKHRQYQSTPTRTSTLHPTCTAQAQNLRLHLEGNILRNTLVQTLAVCNIQACQIIWDPEEHIRPVVQPLKALCVIWEFVPRVGG